MREADILELSLATGHSPAEALDDVVDGETTWVGVYDGVPEVIFGVIPHPEIPNWGVPWLLGTDNIIKFRTAFIRTSYETVNSWINKYEVLTNFVHVDNTISKRWLKMLGFVIFPEAPLGNRGGRFNLFMRKK